MGTFYWNPLTDSWQGTDPNLDVAVISGNTISWDVSGAIFREDVLGSGYAVQGISKADRGLVNKDIGPNNHLVDEFDNMCTAPTSTNPTNIFPSLGMLFSFVFLGLIISSIYLIKRRN